MDAQVQIVVQRDQPRQLGQRDDRSVEPAVVVPEGDVGRLIVDRLGREPGRFRHRILQLGQRALRLSLAEASDAVGFDHHPQLEQLVQRAE
jgi:hypothetical protein